MSHVYQISNEKVLSFENLPVDIRDKLKEGDMIDTVGYRGAGVWYFDGQKLIKSVGSYGSFLPQEAFRMIQAHGIEFFSKLECVAFVLIPSEYTVENEEGIMTGKDRAMSFNMVFDFPYVIVNGIRYDDCSYIELYDD